VKSSALSLFLRSSFVEGHYALAHGSKREFSTTTATFLEKDDEQESKYGKEKTPLGKFTKVRRNPTKKTRNVT
jgi:hypothetical protein